MRVPPPPPSTPHRLRGFSLVEIVVTVAVLGIIASIGIVAVGNVNERSRDTMAKNLAETLNGATRAFSHANWDLRFTASAASAGDEMMVLRSLQYREPDGAGKEVIYKGPYMRDDWNPSTSSDPNDWRIQWTGSSWKWLGKGEAGAGLKVSMDGTDLGTPYVFPPNFKPVGSR